MGAAATALFTVLATNFYALGTYFVALEQHFGWSRTALSGAFSLARLEGAVLGPVEGILTDRLGPRRMVLIGFSLMGWGFILLSTVQGIAGFYVAFILITGGAGLGGSLPMMTAVNNWFSRRRGTGHGLCLYGHELWGPCNSRYSLVHCLLWLAPHGRRHRGPGVAHDHSYSDCAAQQARGSRPAPRQPSTIPRVVPDL